jgi:hypothetical protein
MLTDQQVELPVIGHAIALVGRAHDLADAATIMATAHIGRHVREQQILVSWMPDRTFSEREPGSCLHDRDIGIDQRLEGWIKNLMGHGWLLSCAASAT